jgi:hypothetical protein
VLLDDSGLPPKINLRSCRPSCVSSAACAEKVRRDVAATYATNTRESSATTALVSFEHFHVPGTDTSHPLEFYRSWKSSNIRVERRNRSPHFLQ